jgi:hypothetical protein
LGDVLLVKYILVHVLHPPLVIQLHKMVTHVVMNFECVPDGQDLRSKPGCQEGTVCSQGKPKHLHLPLHSVTGVHQPSISSKPDPNFNVYTLRSAWMDCLSFIRYRGLCEDMTRFRR